MCGSSVGDSAALHARLNNIGSRYYRLLVDQATGRTRADDRVEHLELARLSCSISKQLKALDYTSKSLSAAVPPVPNVGGRSEWLRDIGHRSTHLASETAERAVAVLGEKGSSEPSYDKLQKLSDELKQLSKALLGLDSGARVHPMYTLAITDKAPSADGWKGSLSQALRRVAYAALRARNRRMWKAERGPQPRNALRLLAEDLFLATREALGEPLTLSVHDKTRTYRGVPGNDDTRFLLEFVEWVHQSVPQEIRDARPYLFVSSAIFDAYKEVSEREKRISKLPA